MNTRKRHNVIDVISRAYAASAINAPMSLNLSNPLNVVYCVMLGASK